MLKLLDVAPLPVPSGCGRKVIYDGPIRPRRFDLDTIGRPVRQVTDSISDTVNSVSDSLSAMPMTPGATTPDQFPPSMLVWTVFTVLIALVVCICLAMNFRHRRLVMEKKHG
jgi:hypothetical protein